MVDAAHTSRSPLMHTLHQVCGAMAHMHALGVQHRDIKPQNIFMTAEGEPVLGDFDLSRDTASSIRFVRVCGCTVLCCGQLCVSSNVAFAEHLASPMHAGWT